MHKRSDTLPAARTGLESEDGAHEHSHGQKRQIHPVDGMSFAPACFWGGKAVANDKQIERRHHKENEGITCQPISEAFRARGFQIFLNRHRPDIAGTSFIQVSGRGVMNGMFPFPMEKGGESEQSGDEAEDRVRSL